MKIVFIFLLGVIVLIGAIVLNIIASRLGIMSWYDFLKVPSKANVFSYIWLFIIYPLCLGVVAYFAAKFLNI